MEIGSNGRVTPLASTRVLNVHRLSGLEAQVLSDTLAVEEPLEIRLEFGQSAARVTKSISITMRTPGHDFELGLGFLFGEGIVRTPSDVEQIAFCGPSGNVIKISLRETVDVDLKRLERHFYTSSSCGVCGKSSIEALSVQSQFTLESSHVRFGAADIHTWPDRLREAQGLFSVTGGLHGCALFDSNSNILNVREDVGRHNALDKLIGASLKQNLLPLSSSALLVSGRASFELVQKAAMAGIPFFAAVGAPSSLAVELAQESGMTLIGFLRNNKFNIYNAEHRVS